MKSGSNNWLYSELSELVTQIASKARDPEDCEQEIWVALFAAQRQGQVTKKLGARIGVCTRANLFRKLYRRKKLMQEIPNSRLGKVSRSGEDIFIRQEELDRLDEALASLSSSDRLKVKVLRKEMSAKDYANLECIHIKSARKRVVKLVSKLRNLLTEPQNDCD